MTKEIQVSKLKLNPDNPRVIKDDKFKKLVQSIRDFPEMLKARPIVVNPDMVVLGGNMRLKALQELKVTKTWVYVADWEEAKNKEFIIKDNVGFGEWDWDLLKLEWNTGDLVEWGMDIAMFPFNKGANEDDYEVPDDIKTDIIFGDLFEIGEHRLLCGDSTDSDQVARLMNGNKAGIVFTDPPYDLEDISWSDNMFLFAVGHLFVLNTSKKNVDISSKHRDHLTRWYAVDFRKAHLVSNNAPMDRVDFVAEFRNSENVRFYNRNKGFRTLIESVKNHSSSESHMQEKNPELPGTFIDHFTQAEDLVLDLFLGSGTTMVAAHQLERKCYGMEIDPKYCQVIIDRMKKLDPNIKVKKL